MAIEEQRLPVHDGFVTWDGRVLELDKRNRWMAVLVDPRDVPVAEQILAEVDGVQ